MSAEIVARGFPRELDDHPLLGWMGDDWVTHVIGRLLVELRRQDAETELEEVLVAGPPDMESRVSGGGTARHVRLELDLELIARDGNGTRWRLRGPGTFDSDGTAALRIRSTERLADIPTIEWRCLLCGAEAGSISMDDAQLVRSSFTGRMSQPLEDPGKLRPILDDARSLHSVDPELVPFYCPTCDACYCGVHWDRWDVFDDDMPGWRDSIRGRCPHGHERMLED